MLTFRENFFFRLQSDFLVLNVVTSLRWGKFSQRHNLLIEFISPYSLNTQRGWHTSNWRVLHLLERRVSSVATSCTLHIVWEVFGENNQAWYWLRPVSVHAARGISTFVQSSSETGVRFEPSERSQHLFGAWVLSVTCWARGLSSPVALKVFRRWIWAGRAVDPYAVARLLAGSCKMVAEKNLV